jgi:hypothetical membrane protein
MKKILVCGLIAAPVLYYIALFAGAATYPGYDHATRYASELGAADAPYPWLFNYSIVACGVAAIIGAFGLTMSLRDLNGRWGWAVASGIVLALWGVSMIMGGMFPMPDERHGAFGLGLVAPLVPLFVLFGLWSAPRTAGLKAFLAFIFLASLAVLAVMMGVGGLVRLDNVGIWQRINSGLSIPWMAVLGLWLLLRPAEARAPS